MHPSNMYAYVFWCTTAQVRAQSAPQNARNRLLSRGLPSAAALPATATATAVASAATTAPHSGATTAAPSGVPSGVQTPSLLDSDPNDEEELRYKQVKLSFCCQARCSYTLTFLT